MPKGLGPCGLLCVIGGGSTAPHSYCGLTSRGIFITNNVNNANNTNMIYGGKWDG